MARRRRPTASLEASMITTGTTTSLVHLLLLLVTTSLTSQHYLPFNTVVEASTTATSAFTFTLPSFLTTPAITSGKRATSITTSLLFLQRRRRRLPCVPHHFRQSVTGTYTGIDGCCVSGRSSRSATINNNQEWKEEIVFCSGLNDDDGGGGGGGNGIEFLGGTDSKHDNAAVLLHREKDVTGVLSRGGTRKENSINGDDHDEIEQLLLLISSSSSRPSIEEEKDYYGDKEQNEEIRDVTYEANLKLKSLMSKSFRDTSSKAPHARAAERILNQLEKYGKADTISYNSVINAYAKSQWEERAEKAEEILERMEKVYQNQLERVNLWNDCVAAVTRSKDGSNEDVDILKECQFYLSDNDGDISPNQAPSITVKPNVRTYSSVIDAYSRTTSRNNPSPAHVAHSLLHHLQALYSESNDKELKPNEISYNTVINAWAKTGTVEGATKAMQLLDVMEKEGLADVISYNAVIHAWARCGDAFSGEKAEAMLRRMEKRCVEDNNTNTKNEEIDRDDQPKLVTPNIRTYSSVIDAWSRSNHPNAAQRAQSILNEMETLYKETRDPSIQPNTISYSTVINAHARSRHMANKASAALAVLKQMQYLYSSGENVAAKPTIVSYNSVLNACATTYGVTAQSTTLGSVADSDENGDYYFPKEKGNHDAYSSNENQLLALSIVKMIYKELTTGSTTTLITNVKPNKINENDNDNSSSYTANDKDIIRPDHFTYGTVLKACANLMSPVDDEATTFIRQVFEQCCKDGQVSFGVCFQLRQAAPVDLYRELIPASALDLNNGHFSLKDMPKEWSRNVKERRRYIKNKF